MFTLIRGDMNAGRDLRVRRQPRRRPDVVFTVQRGPDGDVH